MDTKFLATKGDAIIAVRDEQGRFMGCVETTLPPNADIITTPSGEVFQTGIAGVPAILCRDDQDPSRIPDFIPNPNYKSTAQQVAEEEAVITTKNATKELA